ncbi:uncharacterized protein Eint_070160 [Encephalitozoon intestinalis ATCC 50506]|uniref:Uncharacterized protein n=1 Tax=Encephalitozoon intestinalis (strain ATCC 50506) TaxID=876142 RepID=E0S7U6_ENCIT|nr:uncharacterized protein Eint_070160 [Encephalitozoon intestinalis ATCC 50506]ADM11781.2 hypothetical protein Eint_070160 [Encephalitozoon intestinalis ATCC 50506]UTX45529.1 importin [Encephalitozoon intestinalis]
MDENSRMKVESFERLDEERRSVEEYFPAENISNLEVNRIMETIDMVKREAAKDSETLSKAIHEATECLDLLQGLLRWGAQSLEEGSDLMRNILIWLRIRRSRFSIATVEILEGFLKLGSNQIDEDLSQEEEEYLVRILEEIREYIEENILGCNRDSIRMFLFRIFLKSSKAGDTTKVFAFELYSRVAIPAQHEEFGVIIHEIDSLDLFSIGEMNFRDYTILKIYRNVVFRESKIIEESHDRLVNILFEKLLSYLPSRSSERAFSLISYSSSCSQILCVSLSLCYLKELSENRKSLDSKLLILFIENMVRIGRKKEYGEEEIAYFKCKFGSLEPRVAVLRVIKSFVILLLRIIDQKEHKSRIKAAKVLCGIQLHGMAIGRKMFLKILRIARKYMEDRRVTIMKGVINIIGQFDLAALAKEMQRIHSILAKKEMFDKVKDSFQTETCYRAYIDLLSNKDTRDIEYRIEDIKLLARIFYSYENKSVCKFMRITVFSIEDVFVAEFAALYSEFHPNSIDEVYAASILLDSREEITRGKNVLFYNNVLRILMNLRSRFSSELRRRLVVFLRKLVFYSPYTRNAGMLINLLGYGGIEFPRRTDYFVAILGSCGSPYMRDYFPGYSWSPNKELGLVYNLRFDPAFGTAYKWKLEEILSRMNCSLDGKEALVCAELLLFLSETIELNEGAKSYTLAFELVANNSNFIVWGAKSNCISVSKEANVLLKKATKAGAILPHISIPIVFSYYLVSPEMVYTYFETTLSVIREAIENKRLMFKEKGQILEFQMVYDIYVHSKHKSRLVDKLLEVFDECPIKTYYLMSQAVKFEKKDRFKIMKCVDGMVHSYDPDKSRVLLKLHSLFSEVFISSRSKKEMRISNENVLFEENASLDDIDNLRLLRVK